MLYLELKVFALEHFASPFPPHRLDLSRNEWELAFIVLVHKVLFIVWLLGRFIYYEGFGWRLLNSFEHDTFLLLDRTIFRILNSWTFNAPTSSLRLILCTFVYVLRVVTWGPHCLGRLCRILSIWLKLSYDFPMDFSSLRIIWNLLNMIWMFLFSSIKNSSYCLVSRLNLLLLTSFDHSKVTTRCPTSL